MSDTVIIAIISFLGTVAGTIGGMEVVLFRLKALETKVEKHNNYVERTFVLEEQMKVANHRIDDLERHEEERTKRR